MSNSIKREQHDGVVTIVFDQLDSSANVFNCDMFAELDQHLTYIENHASLLRGVVFKSAKPSIFIAGADLKEFAKDTSPERIQFLIELGQHTFNRIEDLSIPTVAAINGACVGGGYELALACDYRVATLDPSTKIGLPETMLGILPAWGGSTRLPRLIGLPKAMGIILAGKVVVTKLAKKLGMIDRVCHEQDLETAAVAMTTQGKRRQPSKPLINCFPLNRVVKSKAVKNVLKTTGGVYPAPLQAVQVMVDGVSRSREQSLLLEKQAFVQLLDSDVAKNLVNIFFLQERSKKTTGDKNFKVKKSAVVGAGVMGSGIAQWLSSRDIAVILKDIKPQFVANGLKNISKLYQAGVSKRVMTCGQAQNKFDLITPITQFNSMSQVDVVVEAAVENLKLKKQLFVELEQHVNPQTILATNTSALSISDVADGLTHPERVVGVHFFNPVHKMKLVEVVRGTNTSEETLHRATQFVKQIGKLPVVVRDSPGFLVNRVLMPYLIEASALFDQGVDVAHVDKLLRKFGMPMGPFRLMDEVGIDVCSHVANDLINRLHTPFPQSLAIEQMLQQGEIGKKSNKGFYNYVKGRSTTARTKGRQLHDDQQMTDRLILIMINEAVRCLQESVVSSPADVDFGMIMGTGWAPFRGGPLTYLDTRGAKDVVDNLEQFAVTDTYFTPCELLVSLAQKQKKIYE